VTDFAMNQLKARRLEIHVDPRNERSARVARRAGFELETIKKNESVDVEGIVRDMLVFVKTD